MAQDGGLGAARGLRLHVLGAFRATAGGQAVAEGAWRLRKARSLVKLLALAPGHRLHREQLQDLLWPDAEPEAAANNLKQAAHWARRALHRPGAGPAVAAQGDLLALCPGGPVWIDVEAFEAAAAAARRERDAGAY